MSWGLLQGLGQGMAQTGDMLMRSRLDELKEQRLQQYRLEAEQRQNERQDAIRAEDHARADAQRATDEKTFREGDVQITEQYNAAGELIGRKEAPLEPKDAQRRFYMSGNTLYDAYNTDKDGNPITVQVGGGAGVTSQQVSAAKDIIRRYTDKVEELTPQEQSELDQAQQIILSAANIRVEQEPGASDVDKAFLEAFQRKRDNAKLDSALVKAGKREEYDPFSGSLDDLVDHGPGLLRMAGESLSSLRERQEARKIPGTKTYLDTIEDSLSRGRFEPGFRVGLEGIYQDRSLPDEMRERARDLYIKAHQR